MLSPTAMCECALVSHASFCASLCPRPACVPRQAERQKPHVSFRWRDPTEIPRCSMCVYGALGIYNIGQSKAGTMGANRLRVPNVACPRGFPYFPRLLGLHIQHSTMRVRASDATCGKRERGWGLLLSSGGEGKKEKGKGSVLMFGLSGNVCQFSL